MLFLFRDMWAWKMPKPELFRPIAAIVSMKRLHSLTVPWNGRRSTGKLYFLRAAARIGRRDAPIRAVEDFRRARFFEPNSPQLPFEEGKIWLGWQPTLAITAWREALQRRGATEAGLYVKMLAEAKERDTTVYESLRDSAIGRPDLMLNYLEDANEAQFTAALGELFRNDPTLSQFTPGQTERFFCSGRAVTGSTT